LNNQLKYHFENHPIIIKSIIKTILIIEDHSHQILLISNQWNHKNILQEMQKCIIDDYQFNLLIHIHLKSPRFFQS